VNSDIRSTARGRDNGNDITAGDMIDITTLQTAIAGGPTARPTGRWRLAACLGAAGYVAPRKSAPRQTPLVVAEGFGVASIPDWENRSRSDWSAVDWWLMSIVKPPVKAKRPSGVLCLDDH
jgi:hypothetical protein